MTDPPSDQHAPGWLERTSLGKLALLLFVGLVAVFHANTTVLEEGDAVPSVMMPLAILDGGTPSFDPERWPEMFKWKTHPPWPVMDDFFFRHWSVKYAGHPAREWYEHGVLELAGPRYYVVESSTKPGRYVSTFGLLPGLVALPLTAVLHAFDPRLDERFVLRLSIAKLHGSLMVAATAVCLLVIAARRTSRKRALLLALTYGLGTCAWAISSQSLWQQTVNQMFLALGAVFFTREVLDRRALVLAGLFLGAAVACRSTSAFVLVACAGYLALASPKRALVLCLAALPLPLVVAAYNFHYFGSPFALAQEVVGHVVAKQKTGSPELWQTPLWLGAAGLLVSPGRGLLVYSPVLGFAFWGIFRAFRGPGFGRLRPLILGALAMMALQCKWFDWWGGWAYGYRPWMDAVPFLVLSILPVLDSVSTSRALRWLYGVLLAWSVFVQGLGAMTYDRSWNVRLLFVTRVPGRARPVADPLESEARALAARTGGIYVGHTFCDIDSPPCRHRLWEIRDSPIPYHVERFAETRGRRKASGWDEWMSDADAQQSAIRAHVE